MRGKKNLKLLWNILGAVTYEDDKVLGVMWIDNGPVQMLSTGYNVGRLHTVERTRKRPRLTSMN